MNRTMEFKRPDKRRHERCKMELLVGIVRDNHFFFEYAMELSEGGMMLNVSSRFQVGENLQMSFFLPPAGKVVQVRAEVVYNLEPKPGKHYAGIRFLNPTPAHQVLIQDCVRSVHEREYMSRKAR